MTWLSSHVRNFVIPGIRTLARANGRTVSDDAIKPFEGRLRASQKCQFHEAGLIYAQVSSVLRKDDPVREIALGLCRQLGDGDDSEFVYELDSQDRVKDLARHYPGVEGADVLHSFLGNITRTLRTRLRASQGTVIFPGRDVWAFEVMAQKMGTRSIYDARISREIDSHQAAFEPVVRGWGIKDWENALAFDSGYAGTVPRAIGRCAGLDRINILMMSARKVHEQVFPGHTGSRAKALSLEYMAKYRVRCLVKNGAPWQPLASLEEFIKASLLTLWIWHHKSPRRLPSWQEYKPPKYKGNGLTTNNNFSIVGGTGALAIPTNWGTALTIPPGWNTVTPTTGTGGIGILVPAATTNTQVINISTSATGPGGPLAWSGI